MLAGPLPSGTYYIYSFDGRLLAEYNLLGQVVRDYVYFGGQLVAEYKNGVLHYYVSDQINSTRIVTDSTGTVVYSAAHEPYGGIQKTWVTTPFDPEPKFSGKPRDAESELDYFGARYYDRAQYRFISTDPESNPMGRTNDLREWNLFSYCRDNPLNFIDPDGAASFSIKRNYIFSDSDGPILLGHTGGCSVPDQILDIRISIDQSGKFCIDVKANGIIVLAHPTDSIWNRFDVVLLGWDMRKVEAHENRHLSYIEKYVLKKLEKLEATLKSDEVSEELHQQIWRWIDEAKQKSRDAMDSILGLQTWAEFIMNLWRIPYDI